jgi:hypothetical protein
MEQWSSSWVLATEVTSNPLSPRFIRFSDVIASAISWITIAFAAALLAFSIWGFWLCQSIASFALPPGSAAANILVLVLTWLILFAPIAVLGTFLLRSALRQRKRSQSLHRSLVLKMQVLPPQQQTGLHSGLLTRSHATHNSRESLADVTTLRLGQLADRAARIVSVTVGFLSLNGGLSGFVIFWIYSRHPLGRAVPWQYELVNFRLLTILLVGCSLAVLFGIVILRETFKKPSTGWWAPLRVFTSIVSRRAAMEESARRRQEFEDYCGGG